MKALILIPIFSIFNCIAIRVYVPPKFTEIASTANATKVQASEIFFKEPNVDYFVTFSSYFFGTSKHKNEYGSIEYLINKELTENEILYQKLLPLKIEITKFELSSTDQCYKNIVKVDLEIKTNDKQGNLIQDYKYTDTIDSMASTCTEIWASLPIFIGWIWYGPYLGFRGSREDQLNQLGRIALMDYFEKLQNLNSNGATKK